MRKLVLLLVVILVCQQVVAQKGVFIRVFNAKHHKIGSGFFSGTTDTSLLVYQYGNNIEFPSLNIKYIKTKRSAGNTIIKSGLIGAGSLGLLGAISGEEKRNDNTFVGFLHDTFTYTPSQGLVAGGFIGGILGVATGGIIEAAKRRPTFTFDGSSEDWQKQRKLLDHLSVRK